MRDPFPFPPLQPLSGPARAIGDYLGLGTFHLHIHEVLYAFLLYHATFAVISPVLSSRLAAKYYHRLPRKSQLQWNMKFVSFVQSVLISVVALWVMFNDEERAKMSREERVWGYTGASGMVQAFAVGYFWWDSYIMLRYTEEFGLAMLAHGLACATVYTLGFRPVFNYYACVFMLFELSTPLVNIHWFLDKVDMTGTPLQIINGLVLIIIFFSARLAYGGYMSWWIFADAYHAYFQTGCDMLKLGQESAPIGELLSSNTSSNCPLPWWITLVYLGGHITLFSLNVFWFYAMIKAVVNRAKGAQKKD